MTNIVLDPQGNPVVPYEPKKVSEIELTQLFVDYAQTRARLDVIRDMIIEQVLLRQNSVNVAGVKATYYKASTGTPDYEVAARMVMPSDFDLEPYTTITKTVKWKDVCQALGKEPDPGPVKPPRVIIYD